MSRLSSPAPLALLAFDHRAEFSRATFGCEPTQLSERDLERLVEAKALIAESYLKAIEVDPAPVRGGILVDEQAGAAVLRASMERDFVLGLPVEKADQDIFTFQFGDDFRPHVQDFAPDFVKALIRYNTDDAKADRQTQIERLLVLSNWLREAGIEFMFELVVRPSAQQLASVDGDRIRYEDELRPQVVLACMQELLAAGIHVDIWKLEGIADPAAAALIGQCATQGGARECVILGGGASVDRVDRWLQVAAGTEGFNGFVIGRSIWREPVKAWLSGASTKDEARASIATEYRTFVQRYLRHAAA